MNYVAANKVNRSAHRYLMSTDKAYFRPLSSEKFSFRFVNKDVDENKELNFIREMTENVEVFQKRVAININKSRKKASGHDAVCQNLRTNVFLYSDGVKVPGIAICRDVFVHGKKITLTINDTNTLEVVVDAPWIFKVELPKVMLAYFPTFPMKYNDLNAQRQLSDFMWSRSTENGWVDVGCDFFYTPTQDDVDCYLKLTCIPKNEEMSGPAFEVVSTEKVRRIIKFCPFERRHLYTLENIEDNFRVVTYNILASHYAETETAKKELYPYCPVEALSIDYRFPLILKELKGYNGDLICLQEVDCKIFNALEIFMEHLDYAGKHSRKGPTVPEGLAFFYNKTRYRLLNTLHCVFSEEMVNSNLCEDIFEAIKDKKKIFDRIVGRNTFVDIELLEDLRTSHLILIGHTHFYYHPDADYVRILHGAIGIRILEYHLNKYKQEYPDKKIAVLFCGDFNSSPDNGVYQLFTTGHIPKNFKGFFSAEDEDEHIEEFELRQNVLMKSAYSNVKYTNYTKKFKDVLDYIFYSPEYLAVHETVPIPSDAHLSAFVALPSIVSPSDHVALIANFKFK